MCSTGEDAQVSSSFMDFLKRIAGRTAVRMAQGLCVVGYFSRIETLLCSQQQASGSSKHHTVHVIIRPH